MRWRSGVPTEGEQEGDRMMWIMKNIMDEGWKEDGGKKLEVGGWRGE
jgi:hypothetical protein